MRDGIYFAELRFGGGVGQRPPVGRDRARRCAPRSPIFGADAVLDEAGIEIPDEQEDEVEKFREFLDQISPEDFAAGG